MRRLLSILALLVAAGCATSNDFGKSLQPLLPDEEPDGFRFFHGSWIWPDSIYAFQLTPDSLYVVDRSVDEGITAGFSVAECPEIEVVYAGLTAAVLTTAEVATGARTVAEPDVIVLDGPDYRLEYWSRDASTWVVLKGGGNAQLVTPWVDAAYAVRSVGEECAAN